jgi:pimeloyl-ACP methyl ester carboxylesterase
MRYVPRWLVWLLGAYVAVVLVAWLAQGFVLFGGRRSSTTLKPSEINNDYELVRIKVDRVGEVVGVFRHVSDPRGAALLLLDDAECVSSARPAIEVLASLGLATLCVDYPGYGGSDGSPSADSLRAMAHACYLHLTGIREFDSRRIWPIGRRLGSGPACHLAARVPVAGLILLSPFTNLRAATAIRFPWLPVRVILRHDFDNERELGATKVRVLIAWAEDDLAIPAAMPERLALMTRGAVTRYVQQKGGPDGLRIETEGALAVALDEFLRAR